MFLLICDTISLVKPRIIRSTEHKGLYFVADIPEGYDASRAMRVCFPGVILRYLTIHSTYYVKFPRLSGRKDITVPTSP